MYILGSDRMDVNMIMQAVSTLGFPIVCCAALFWKSNKDQQLHREESKEWIKAIDNNTIVVQKLLDKLTADSKSEDK